MKTVTAVAASATPPPLACRFKTARAMRLLTWLLPLTLAGLVHADDPLAVATDGVGLAWTTGGDAAWFAQSTTTHDGVDAARSGTISASQESWMQTTVTGPGTLTYWWKVSSESGYDYLEFYLDGVLQSGRISGEVEWQQCSRIIPDGSHPLQWRYMKDGSLNRGQDAGWVDQVDFLMDHQPPQMVVEPVSRTNPVGTAATFSVIATGSSPLTYQWRKNEANLTITDHISGVNSATLTLSNVQWLDIGSYSVVVTNAYGSVTSTAASLTLAPPMVTTGTASGITATTATLRGTVNPNGLASVTMFEYGLTKSYGGSVVATPSPVTDGIATAVSASLSGLLPGTTYHYRVSATSAAGTGIGVDMTFATLSTNADLSGLALGTGTLAPVFNGATTAYTVSVATSSITVMPTVADPTATVRVNGSVVASGGFSGEIPLVAGAKVISTVVTAGDGITTKTYTVTVTRLNADLASLTTSAGTLAPVFSAATTVYTANVSNATTSMTVTPVVSDAAATVKVNGVTIAPGGNSGAIHLTPGTNVFNIVVTASDGIATKAYGLTVIRESAELAALTTSAGALTPTFDSATTAYTMSVPFEVSGLRLTPTLVDSTATVTVNGLGVSSGTPSGMVGLTGGANTIIILVTALDAGTKTYTLEVTRSPNLAYAYNSPSGVAVAVTGLTATGCTANLSLNFAPVAGTNLTVVNNTGTAPISGSFSNLAQGQRVLLSFGGITYPFVVNYYGGSGNDLVLQWATTRALAWGYNGSGQLGNGGAANSSVPLAVTATGILADKTLVAVAAGNSHSLALCTDGTVAAWGNNDYGQLGTGNTSTSYVPVAVTTSGILTGKTVVAIAAGGYHSLALCSDGTVAAWGYNGNGRLGDNGYTYSSSVPVAVTSSGILTGKTVVAIAAGDSHSLALCSDGTVAAWGYNGYGQLGTGNTSTSYVPITVTTSGILAGKTVVHIAAGYYHSLALCSDGTVAAWGYNGYGQLGNGSATDSSVPVAVTSSGILAGKTVANIAASYYHSLALCSDGTVAAWGYNGWGQLGNNSYGSSSVPVAVTTSGILTGKTVANIAAGYHYCLALCSDGTLAAWGNNGSGQLGNNSSGSSIVPVAVSASSLAADERFVAAASGQSSNHSLALVAAPPWPVVATAAATSITSAGATLNASVNANSNSTAASFEYGLTTAYGSTIAATPSPVTGEEATAVSASPSGLIPGTTYHYRVNATNAAGSTTGADMTFATPSTNANL
ncbi:MAG: cadherin-like beta sandwich domain-containing protein, partial [Verrucomicrobia bacterium]|nr:cadherin-like beta sandwich domain-containing protein [Verrucomicrobiota bacterium]